MFHFRQTLVTGRDGCYLEEEMDVEKRILLVRTTRQFTTPRVVDTGTASYIDGDVHNNKKTPVTTVIMFLLLLGLLFKVCIR